MPTTERTYPTRNEVIEYLSAYEQRYQFPTIRPVHVDHIEQMDALSLAISNGLTVFDLVQQSWLCLPGKTPLVPMMVEAAQEYIRQENLAHTEVGYAD